MSTRESILLKRAMAFIAAMFMLFVMFVSTSSNILKVDASALSEIPNERRLAVEHKKEGALDKEVQTALETSSMNSSSVQLLVISGSTRLSEGDWTSLKNRVGLPALTSLYFDGYTAEDTIPEKALYSADWILNLKLSNSIRSVGKSAFERCTKLTTVELDGVKTIEERAFADTGLTSIKMPEALEVKASAFESDTRLREISADKLEIIGASAFYNCTALTQLSFPNLDTIERSGFEKSTSLNNLSMPALSRIGSDAFKEAGKLKQIIVGNNVAVGSNSFANVDASILVLYSGVAPTGLPATAHALQYEGSIVMPKNQTVAEGASIYFEVKLAPSTASGFKIDSYQWYLEGRAIIDSKATTHGVKNVRVADEGNYQVRIEFAEINPSSSSGAVAKKMPSFTSIPATLAIQRESLEAITGLPANYEMRSGDKVTWRPNPKDGTWTYDRTAFSLLVLSDGNYEFTALKDGKYTLIYTAPNKNTHKVGVAVGEANFSSKSSSSGKDGSGSTSKPVIPGTGQGMIYIGLAVGAVAAISVGLVVTLRKKS